jgi:hypothetical protein
MYVCMYYIYTHITVHITVVVRESRMTSMPAIPKCNLSYLFEFSPLILLLHYDKSTAFFNLKVRNTEYTLLMLQQLKGPMSM